MQIQTIETMTIKAPQHCDLTEADYIDIKRQAEETSAALDAELVTMRPVAQELDDQRQALLAAVADNWQDAKRRAALLAELQTKSIESEAASFAVHRLQARIQELRSRAITAGKHAAIRRAEAQSGDSLAQHERQRQARLQAELAQNAEQHAKRQAAAEAREQRRVAREAEREARRTGVRDYIQKITR